MKIHMAATFSTIVLLVSSLVAQEQSINVADHGIVPGKDVTLQVNRLIESLADKRNVTVVFPKGEYTFKPVNGHEKFHAVSNHDNSLKRMAFPIFGGENITIDGGGSTFMFTGRISPIVIDGVNGANLKNFSIDWDRPFQTEMNVVENDEANHTFTVEIDRKRYPYTVNFGTINFVHDTWTDPFGSNMVFDPKTQAPIYDTNAYSVSYNRPVPAKAVGENRVQFKAKVKKLPPVGSVLVSYGVNPTSRLCQAIHVANSKNVQIENVTVYAAGGMALIVERTENVSLEKFVVTSTADRMISTRADATHFVGCKGTIKLDNCLLEHMLDDSINVHGAYVRVDEYLGDNEFLCEISHPQQWGLIFAEPGDKVAILSRETVLPFHQTTVADFKILNEQRFTIKLADVPNPLPDVPMSLENLTWYPDVVMKNCTVRQNRARSALITTKGKVLIDGNYFSSQMHGILIEGDNKKWYESGSVQDVTISNNIFENIGFESGPVYPLLASPMLTEGQRVGEGHYHRNIRFVNNTIKSFNGLIAQARSIQGLTIADNTIELSKDYPANSEFPSIDLNYCDDVKIEGNQVMGFDRTLNIEQSADTTNVSISNNEGLELEGGGANDKVAEDTTAKQAASPQNSHDARKPNIVLFFVDDMGWADLGYRNPKFESPNVDKLASEGLDFQQAYIACPTCSPSRATLLTGLHPARTKMVRHIPNDPEHGFDKFQRTEEQFNYWAKDPAKFPCPNWLNLEYTTYAEALRELDYYNLFVGKWHLGHEPYHPIHQGFDKQIGTSNAGHPNGYYPPYFKNSDVFADEKERYLTDKLTDETVEFIEEYDSDQPFMLSMWYYNVHGPHQGRKDLVAHFKEKGLTGVDAQYAAMVKSMDESVGRVREAIAKKGIEQDTIVIFLSDQGGAFDNPPFHGGKKLDTLYEGGARVPMIVHWPGVTKSGTQNNSIVQSTDLFPTLIEIAGGDSSKFKNLDGVSLLSTIRDNSTLNRGEPIYGYRAYEDLYASVREGDWKLLAYRSGILKLYNIANDVGEQNDLAAVEPQKTEALRAKFAEWEKQMNVQKYSGVQPIAVQTE